MSRDTESDRQGCRDRAQYSLTTLYGATPAPPPWGSYEFAMGAGFAGVEGVGGRMTRGGEYSWASIQLHTLP